MNLATILGLALVMVPGLARAQAALPFDDLVFIERGIIGAAGNEADGSAICDQYYGHNALTGGGLFLLRDFRGAKQKVDIVAGLTVPAGKTNAGQPLSSGTFLSPDLSFDGKTLVFAWSSGGTEKWTAKNRFHLFKVDLDGQNLVQLTDGNFDDFHPAWLPNGRIVFVSTRRGGFANDHSRPVPSYTLHSMKSDGSDLIRLSNHVFNEFHPSISNLGDIVYTRDDHIDRDTQAAHHIWLCYPDGSNPRSWGGNYALPLDTFSGGPWIDGRKDGKRPLAELYPRAIPGSSTKFVAVAGPLHGEAYGTLIIRDFGKVDDNRMGQVTKLTPEVGLPETAENGTQTYGPAWPLSETLFLTSHDNSLVLLDTSVTPAKRTEYYRTSKSTLRPIYPIPVAPRTTPPIIPEATFQGERWTPSTCGASIGVADVTITDAYGRLPDGVKIRAMRIVQVLPKTTPTANDPRLGFSSQNIAKLSLGTVPVEDDGSVFFEAPIGREILFQLLDEKGMAVQTMRSGTYVHPGEQLRCIGCHDDKGSTAVPPASPRAFQRPPSKMAPESGRVEPINFARHVVPILKRCVPCHQNSPAGPFTTTKYQDMWNYAFWFAGDTNGNLEAQHGGSRSKPGMIGARGSRMGKALLNETHQKAQAEGKFTVADVITLAQWLDLGSDELGSYDNPAAQLQGSVVWPSLDFDSNNPQGDKCEPEIIVPPPPRDAGAAGPDLAPADVPQAEASPVANDGAPASGGTAGTSGPVGSGGQSGSGSQIPAGGAGGAGGVGAAGGAGGAGGAARDAAADLASTASTGVGGGPSGSGGGGTAQGTTGSGGQPGSGSQGPGRLGNRGGCRCSMGENLDEPPALWLLLVMGLALLGRRGRNPIDPSGTPRRPGG